jgi:serine/threonine-protein kinase
VFVSPALETVVRKCMSKHPEDRYSSMDELLGALKRTAGASLTVTGEHSLMVSVANANDRVSMSVGNVPQATGTGPLFVASSKNNAGTPALYLAVLIVLSGIAAVVAIGNPFGSDAPAAEAPQVAAEPKPAAGAAVEAQDDMTDRTVLVSLRSTPPGATVLVEGQEYGPTPTQFEWSGSEAAYGRVVKFLFRRQGYHDLTVTRQVRGERMDVHAPPLEPLPQAKKPVRLQERAAGALAPTGTEPEAE